MPQSKHRYWLRKTNSLRDKLIITDFFLHLFRHLNLIIVITLFVGFIIWFMLWFCDVHSLRI